MTESTYDPSVAARVVRASMYTAVAVAIWATPHAVAAQASALFTGDILVHPLPFAFGVWPLPWIDVLRQLEAIPVVALVPGHGPVLPDHTYTRLVRELLDTMRTRVDSLFRQESNLTTAPAAVDVRDFRARFVASDGTLFPESDWAVWTRNLAEQMVQCVHGYRC